MNDGLHWKQGHAFHLARQLPAAEKWLVQRSEGGISRIAIDLVYYTIYCLFHQLKCLIVPNSGCSTFGDATHLRSRTRHSTGPTLLAKQGFLPALLGPVYCAGFLGDANHWEEASE